MRLILALFPLLLLASDGFGIGFSIGPSLSDKNLLIAAALLLIVLRAFRAGRLPVELPVVQAAFVTLIAYAIVTWFVASFVIEYERYPVRQNAILLKILLADQYLAFLVSSYGPRNDAEVLWGLKWLLGVIVMSHAFTIGAWAGWLPAVETNREMIDWEGRVHGLIAHANQYALLTVALLPAMVAMAAVARRRAERVFWGVATVLAVGAMGLVASRAATLAAVVAGATGMYLFRERLSGRFLLKFAAIAAVVVVGIGFLLASSQYGEYLYDRVVGDTVQESGLSRVSKGRTDWWLQALDKMADAPITFLTGFGWRAYYALPHVLAPHNTYLDNWFNLGLPGLLALIALLGAGIKVSAGSVARVKALVRPHVMAASIGIIAVSVGLFFTEWYQPWMYFWAYYGLVMRMAIGYDSETAASGTVRRDRVATASGTARASDDPYGWSAGDRFASPVRVDTVYK